MASEDLDDCQFCRGAEGNVKGNENVFADVIVCDDCSILVSRIINVGRRAADLTEEEREALRMIANDLRRCHSRSPDSIVHIAGLRALDKLLGGGGR